MRKRERVREFMRETGSDIDSGYCTKDLNSVQCMSIEFS